MIRRMVLAAMFALVPVMNACSQEAKLPTHLAKVNIEPARYSEFIASLDVAMATYGLARYGAAPGLDEIYKRPVLYFEYRAQASDKWAFLTASDLVKVGIVDVRVYSMVLEDEKSRKAAMSRIGVVLSQFGGSLVAQ